MEIPPRPTWVRPQEGLDRIADELGIDRDNLVSPKRLAELRHLGGGPPFIKPKRSVVLYEWTAFKAWMLERVEPRASTARDAVARRQNARRGC